MILAVKIIKLEPHGGYYLKLRQKLINAKPITNKAAQDIVDNISKWCKTKRQIL